jgi:hypothetical protein
MTPAITLFAHLLAKEMKAAPELVDGKQISYFTFEIIKQITMKLFEVHLKLNDPFVRIASVDANNYENSIPSETQSMQVEVERNDEIHTESRKKLTKNTS